jgi:hypothetical protein
MVPVIQANADDLGRPAGHTRLNAVRRDHFPGFPVSARKRISADNLNNVSFQKTRLFLSLVYKSEPKQNPSPLLSEKFRLVAGTAITAAAGTAAAATHSVP